MVAADGDLGAAEVLPHDGVHYRLPRAGVLHLVVEDAHHDQVAGVVVLHQGLVRVHDDLVGEVSRLLLDEPLDALLEGAGDGDGGVLVHFQVFTIMGNYTGWRQAAPLLG